MNFKLKTLVREVEHDLLLEVLDFNNIDGYEYLKRGKFKYDFVDENRLNIYVGIEHFDKNEFDQFKLAPFIKDKISDLYNVGYAVEGRVDQYSKQPLKSFLRILKTVHDIILEIISDLNPDCISIISANKDGTNTTDQKKDKIYEKMWKNNPPSGYGINEITFINDNLTGFCLYKNEIRKRK